MKHLKLALICSGTPGFLRAAAHGLSSQCRFLESWTLSEAVPLASLHQPDVVVIDGRQLAAHQVARVQALMEACRQADVVFVARSRHPGIDSLPPDLRRRLRFLPADEADADLSRHLADAVHNRTATSASASHDPQSSELGGRPEASPRDESTTGTASGTDRAPLSADTVSDPVSAPASHRSAGSMTAEGHSHAAPPDDEDDADAAINARTSPLADEFRTRTPDVRHMLRRLSVAARHHVTLLLIGETGSGKTHLASLIHRVSGRSDHPFLHVACGALPGELIESELFGHTKGSFTSAHADKVGKFVAAGKGTILLDEIDVLTPEQQVKLLRVIETGEFEPVGSNETHRLQARVIAASNLPLQPLVSEGRFRADLFYRLSTLSFTIPPLRKRLPDIEPLARYFVHRHAAQHGIDVVDIAPDFFECLLSYPWPGNVRELENAVRSAVIYATGGRLTRDTLPQHIVDGHLALPSGDPSTTAFFAVRAGDSLGERIDLTEKDIIEQALFHHNYSRTNTARHLGISRVTLYNKMRKHGIVAEK